MRGVGGVGTVGRGGGQVGEGSTHPLSADENLRHGPHAISLVEDLSDLASVSHGVEFDNGGRNVDRFEEGPDPVAEGAAKEVKRCI